jgi:hypothetical protein
VKPHEQEWTYEPAREGFFGHHQHVNAGGVLIPPPSAPDEDTEALLRFIAAAPEMARALLDVTPIVDGVAHSPLCGVHGLGADRRCHYTCESINAALRKAGVL